MLIIRRVFSPGVVHGAEASRTILLGLVCSVSICGCTVDVQGGGHWLAAVSVVHGRRVNRPGGVLLDKK